MFQTLSRLFQFAEDIYVMQANFWLRRRRSKPSVYIKTSAWAGCNAGWQISLELISWGLHSSLERERKFRRSLFSYSIKREVRHFHVVVVQ